MWQMSDIDMVTLRQELVALYSDMSKHAAYQTIPDFVANALDYQVSINEEWRGDRVRLDYIQSYLLDRQFIRWADFGANTGLFSLSLAHADPGRQVLAIEANPKHAAFIRRIADAFKLNNVEVIGRPLAIDDLESIPPQDVMLHLNVLHHAGMDFDKGRVTGPGDFMAYAETYLHRLRASSNMLVFQVGSNLWGDKTLPIVDYQEDAEKLILFAGVLNRAGWEIEDISYAAKDANKKIAYRPVPRVFVDSLAGSPSESEVATALDGYRLSSHTGEFYRRPLFICRRNVSG